MVRSAGSRILLRIGGAVHHNGFACPAAMACGRLAGSEFGVRVVIDPDGYRPNVGIVLMRTDGRLFWARRVNRDGWQFPQGGMNTDETPLEAMYRELHEEVGLLPEHVEVLGATPGWLRYRLPKRCVRYGSKPICVGQKQVWFLLRFNGDEADLRLNLTEKPEFDSWRWVDFWYPVEHVVNFKREVYVRALHHLSDHARIIAGDEAIPIDAGTLVQQILAATTLTKFSKR